MDISMPVMDGYEATRAIRNMEKKQKILDIEEGEVFKPAYIVGVTAHLTDNFLQQCLQNGMDEYMTKPVESGEVERVLRLKGLIK
mmetsp:Transcript_34541/g.33741  ORF Transcript_34541/g.33741 Transcript_34541/m.33741 type:complete len:85 (-) Transcript_34541:28-282(-)